MIKYVLLFFYCCLAAKTEVDNGKIANKLLKKLYSKQRILGSLKAPKHQEPMFVDIAFVESEVKKIESKKQLLHVTGTIILFWNDNRLVWKPESYKNYTWIRLKTHKIWMPPLEIENGKMSKYNRQANIKLSTTHKGRVRYVSTQTFVNKCPLAQFDDYPKDRHECGLTFWIDTFSPNPNDRMVIRYQNETLNLRQDATLLHLPEKIVPLSWKNDTMSKWKITRVETESRSEIESMYFRSVLLYKIYFQRKKAAFGTTFLLINAVSVALFAMMFKFRLGSQERYLFALILFVLRVPTGLKIYKTLPSTDRTPRLLKFYGLSFWLVLIFVVESFILHRLLLNAGEKRTPIWLQNSMENLACFRKNRSENKEVHLNDVIQTLDTLFAVFSIFIYAIGYVLLLL